MPSESCQTSRRTNRAHPKKDELLTSGMNATANAPSTTLAMHHHGTALMTALLWGWPRLRHLEQHHWDLVHQLLHDFDERSSAILKRGVDLQRVPYVEVSVATERQASFRCEVAAYERATRKVVPQPRRESGQILRPVDLFVIVALSMNLARDSALLRTQPEGVCP